MLNNRLINSLLVFCSLLLFFFCAELYLRFKVSAWPFEKSINTSFLNENEKALLWKHPLEFRNQNIADKQTDEFRILFLGDSLFFTSDTTSGKFFHQVVQENLNTAQKKYKIRTINCGIPGYTTFQELEYLKVYGLSFKPNLVVLGFVNNDLYYPYLHLPSDGGKKIVALDPRVKLSYIDPETPLIGPLFKNSYFANGLIKRLLSLKKRIERKFLHRPYLSFDYRPDFYLAWKSYGWKKTEELITEMRDLLYKKGIRFVVIAFPVSEQTSEENLKADQEYVLFPQKKIKEICESRQIPFLDLTPIIIKSGGPRLYRDYHHLSPTGNDVLSAALSEFLKDQIRRADD